MYPAPNLKRYFSKLGTYLHEQMFEEDEEEAEGVVTGRCIFLCLTVYVLRHSRYAARPIMNLSLCMSKCYSYVPAHLTNGFIL